MLSDFKNLLVDYQVLDAVNLIRATETRANPAIVLFHNNTVADTAFRLLRSFLELLDDGTKHTTVGMQA